MFNNPLRNIKKLHGEKALRNKSIIGYNVIALRIEKIASGEQNLTFKHLFWAVLKSKKSSLRPVLFFIFITLDKSLEQAGQTHLRRTSETFWDNLKKSLTSSVHAF